MASRRRRRRAGAGSGRRGRWGGTPRRPPCSRRCRRSPRRGLDLELAARCDGVRRRRRARRAVGWRRRRAHRAVGWRRRRLAGQVFRRSQACRPKVTGTITRLVAPGQARLRENAQIGHFQQATQFVRNGLMEAWLPSQTGNRTSPSCIMEAWLRPRPGNQTHP
jgi:hypothetical protein